MQPRSLSFDPRPLALCLALLCAACSQGQTAPVVPGIQPAVALVQAASCASLTQSVQDLAVQQMRAQLDSEKLNGGAYGYPAVAMGGVAGTPSAAGPAPASYTTTNTQVAGVDEADFVKNDGTRIFTLSGQTLFTATSWPPESLAVVGKLTLEGWPSEMFLDGNRLAIFSSVWTQPTGGGAGPGSYGGMGGGGVGAPISTGLCALNGGGCFWGWSTTKITVVDVTDASKPTVTSELYLPGYSTGARRVGSSIRLVLSDSVRWPEGLQWWPSYDPSLYTDHDKLVSAIDALEAANEAVIRAQPLQGWFPYGQRKLPSGGTIDVSYSCSDFYLPNAPERLGLVTIATLDLANLAAGVSRSSIVGEAGVLYATQSRLYLASQHWWWWPFAGQRDWTYVHAFDLTDPAKASYVASGGVEGHLGDQFAMDEKDGYLRLATSTAVWLPADANNPWGSELLGSRLSVLAPQPVTPAGALAPTGNRLALVGEIASLEDGERITATRFTGDKAFALTARYIDPLVTLDLTDPAHPKKIAELTIPGFSTYLQAIDATHLLSIGDDIAFDANGAEDWSHRAVMLSLFDVSDLAHPKLAAKADVGTAWAYSEALWDHYAFNWYQPDPAKPGLLAIPFSDWMQPTGTQQWWDGFVSDVHVFSVDTGAASIALQGKLTMSDIYITEGDGNFTWWYRPWVRRSVMATDTAGNTFVYAVSDGGLRSAALGALDKPLATALFPRAPLR